MTDGWRIGSIGGTAMRLAVVSDIHGNLSALEAVAADVERRGVDQVVHGGDVALIGARPAEVIDRLADLGWPGIVGNTDEPVGTEIVVYGHIHRPFVRRPGERTVTNAGSVGLPFDGDARASYLLITEHGVEVLRVEYAIEEEVAALRTSGYPDVDRIAE